MSRATESFITNFHSLDGVTIGEKRKSLFRLLKQFQPSNLDINFSFLCPKTPLEESFKLEAQLYFRRTLELDEVWKSENPAVIKKLLKMTWFIVESSKNPTSLLWVLSHTSYNVKVKLLNRLGACLCDFQQGDCLFGVVRERYGLYLALKLLPACSENLILEHFNRCFKQIFARHVLIILRHRPELAEPIFTALSCKDKNRAASVYEVVFIQIGRSNHPAFIKLYQQHQLCFRLGKRATHKLIRANKQLIIAEATNLYKLLHRAEAIKRLGGDFQDYYVKLFPTLIERFSYSCSFLLDTVAKLSPDRRLSLIEDCFKRAYGCNVWDNETTFTLDLLHLAGSARCTDLLCKPPLMSQDHWTCYFRTERSIPLLKKRISLSTDVSMRLTLVAYLVETCKVNSDKTALAEICRYFVKQHRNDHISVRNRFLTTLQSMFELEHLGEDHWRCINELLEIFEMNHETFSLTCVFQLGYIHHNFLKGLSVDALLTEYLKQESNSWYLFRKSSKLERHCLLLLGEIVPRIFNTDGSKHLKFLSCLISWNQRHPNAVISIFQYTNSLDAFTASTSDHENADLTHRIAQYLLTLDLNTDLANLCVSQLRYCNWWIFQKLLRDKLMVVRENIESLTELTLRKPCVAFWRHCRYYAHLGIPQRIVSTCLGVINANSRSYRTRNAIICISYLTPAADFLASVATHYPTERQAVSCTAEQRAFYHLQKAYTSALKNVTPTSLALPAALKFCQGDYLKIILNTLYSLSSNVNESILSDFLVDLSTRSVSVRKHVIHLTLRVLDRTAILKMFTRFVHREKNSSLRKFLLKGSFRQFLQDADDFMWNVVKLDILSVDTEDKEAFDLLMRIQDVPSTYVTEYVLFLWNFFNVTSTKDEYIERKMWELLRMLTPEDVQMLPVEFPSEIIQKYFEKFLGERETATIKPFISSVHNFACKYVVYCTDRVEQERRMNMVLLLLKRCLCEDQLRCLVDDFLKIFCGEFLVKKFIDKHVLTTFISIWDNQMDLDTCLDQYVYLQLTVIYVDGAIDNLSLDDVGKRVAQLGFWLTNKYSSCAVFVLSDLFKSFSRYFLQDDRYDSKRYALIDGIIKNCQSNLIMIVAIVLLKCNVKDTSLIQSKHYEIVEKLKNAPDPFVSIYLNHYLYRMNV